MKIKFIAESASLTKPDLNGDCFTTEALKQIAEQCKNKPITYNFDLSKPLGRIESGQVINDKVIINGSLDGKHSKFLNDPYFVVPAFEAIEKEIVDGVIQVSKLRLIEMGITKNPADINITPLALI